MTFPRSKQFYLSKDLPFTPCSYRGCDHCRTRLGSLCFPWRVVLQHVSFRWWLGGFLLSFLVKPELSYRHQCLNETSLQLKMEKVLSPQKKKSSTNWKKWFFYLYLCTTAKTSGWQLLVYAIQSISTPSNSPLPPNFLTLFKRGVR